MSGVDNLFSWLGRTFGLGIESRRIWASLGGVGNWSGETVTPEKAMTIAAVFRAVRLTAETIATLPKNLYRYGADGRGILVRDGNNPYDLVLRVSPNAGETPVEFWEGLIGCMLLVGDGMAEKHRVSGRLVGMTLMDPNRVAVTRDANGVTYRYTDQNGKLRVLTPDDVFHLRGFGFGGDRGMSVITFGANSLGATIAAEKVAGKLWKSGLSSSGFIETNVVLEEGDRDRLTNILSEYQGSDNAGKTMILEGGMKYSSVSIKPDDAQLLVSRQFNIEEVGRWFGMPPILLGHSGSGQTNWGSGVEQIIQAWYTLSLRALITRVEFAVMKRVFEPADRLKYYFKINVEGLLRGDSAARAALYSVFAQNGIMTRDEMRDLEELEPYEFGGSDRLTAQVNLTTLDKIGQGPDSGTKGGVPPVGDAPATPAQNLALMGDAATTLQLLTIERRLKAVERKTETPAAAP